MNTPNPVIYEYCRSAWKQYRRDMGLPVASLPGQEPEVVEVGAAGRLLQALRALFASRKPDSRALQSGVALKSVARQHPLPQLTVRLHGKGDL